MKQITPQLTAKQKHEKRRKKLNEAMRDSILNDAQHEKSPLEAIDHIEHSFQNLYPEFDMRHRAAGNISWMDRDNQIKIVNGILQTI